MNNISSLNDCYGCGVCAIVCSRRIIEIRLNEDGFYEPYITDVSRCTDCGLCCDVCAYCQDGLSLVKWGEEKSYAAWSNDSEVRNKSSSGGVGFELGRILINRGYRVCGVHYNIASKRAEHYVATTIEELIPSIGSKYIPSYTVDGFRVLDRKGKYLLIGTPCQIDSFRRYIQKFKIEDNFILVDFFCHGVPSMLLWGKYVKEIEKEMGEITNVSWRNKLTGWHDSYAMSIEGGQYRKIADKHDYYNEIDKEKRGIYNSRFSQGDPFYSLFLGNVCLGKACYDKCKYKYNHSSADIRIGDLWGKVYQDNEEGVSATIAFTPKGNVLLKECNCKLIEHPFEVVAEGQMKECPKRPACFLNVMSLLKNENVSLAEVLQLLLSYEKRERNINRLKHPMKTGGNILKRIKKYLCR